ncbi:MAG: hypothetical protein ACKN81_09035, partial [Pirellulaceae bacterium]
MIAITTNNSTSVNAERETLRFDVPTIAFLIPCMIQAFQPMKIRGGYQALDPNLRSIAAHSVESEGKIE